MTKKEFIENLRKTKEEQIKRFEENLSSDRWVIYNIRYGDKSDAWKEMIILDKEFYELADYIENPSELFKSIMIEKGQGQYIINYLSEEEKKQLLLSSAKAAEFKLLENPSDELINIALRKDYKNFKYIVNPTQEQKLYGLSLSGKVIRYIKEPTEKEQLEAIENSEKGETIKYIENPTKQVVERALERDIENILYISELYFEG